MNESMLSWVKNIRLSPPSLANNTADVDRLVDALKAELQTDHIRVDHDLMQAVPSLIRQCRYHLRCILFEDAGQWLLVGLADGAGDRGVAGVAIDLGTSRVVLRLVDLADGTILDETVFDNPQAEVGPDVLTRTHYAGCAEKLTHLQHLIVDAVNEHTELLCRQCNLRPTDVYLLSVAGNTVMTHLFMGLDPRFIIREPYIPVVNRPGVQRAADMGIHADAGARIFIFPNIGSYFGGDLIAGVLSSGLHKQKETSILVDVGTNAEVVVGNRDWLMACAGAAGPALEGGVSRMGMMAGPGVIERVHIDVDTGKWDLKTIDDAPPVGICGSGMIDLAAQLFLAGMLDIRGKLVASACAGRLEKENGLHRLVVIPASASATGEALTISQADIDSLIRSKAAMYTILETITSHVGMGFNDLHTFFIAGTFGSFIDPVSAIAIGMIPDLPLSTYRSLGNSSLEGATMALLSRNVPAEIDRIRNRITYMELNVNQDFMNRFSAARFLPHTDRLLFPSVKILQKG